MATVSVLDLQAFIDTVSGKEHQTQHDKWGSNQITKGPSQRQQKGKELEQGRREEEGERRMEVWQMRGKRVMEKDGGGETKKSDGEGREGKEVRT